MKIGTTSLTTVKRGATQIQKIMQGNNLVWEFVNWEEMTGTPVIMTSNSLPTGYSVSNYSALPDGGAITGAEYLVFDNNTGTQRIKDSGWSGTRVGSQLSFTEGIKIRSVYFNAEFYCSPSTSAAGNIGLQIYSSTRGQWIDLYNNTSTHALSINTTYTVSSTYTNDIFTAVRGWVGYNAGNVSGSMRLREIKITSWAEKNGSIKALGGIISTTGGYKVHTFTSSSSLNLYALPATSAYKTIEYLVIAGGGGGGSGSGGGGGAGGYRSSVIGENSGANSAAESTITATVKSYTVTVGGGGAGGTNDGGGGKGGNSVFDSITATGGGGGASKNAAAQTGGSGGGASWLNNITGGAGTTNQGYAGSNKNSLDSGAGGGAGSSSGNMIGGNGMISSITGVAIGRAGGGGGGTTSSGGSNTATSGGGNGGRGGVGANATANTGGGGGGGGAGQAFAGGAGGSGIVIIRYPIPIITPSGYTLKTGSLYTMTGATTPSPFVVTGRQVNNFSKYGSPYQAFDGTNSNGFGADLYDSGAILEATIKFNSSKNIKIKTLTWSFDQNSGNDGRAIWLEIDGVWQSIYSVTDSGLDSGIIDVGSGVYKDSIVTGIMARCTSQGSRNAYIREIQVTEWYESE